MNFHWHERAALCETMHFLPGGDMEFYRSLGVYRNSTLSGPFGMKWTNRLGERCTWRLNSHYERPAGSPDLEVFVRSPGNEEMWRNVVSANLDQDLWPQLSSTPLLLRLWMRIVRMIPFIGERLCSWIVGCVLWVQLLLIFQRHNYWVWCGYVSVCQYFHAPGEMAPEWAQQVEWNSARILTIISMRGARLGAPLLGLKDGYPEYS